MEEVEIVPLASYLRNRPVGLVFWPDFPPLFIRSLPTNQTCPPLPRPPQMSSPTAAPTPAPKAAAATPATGAAPAAEDQEEELQRPPMHTRKLFSKKTDVEPFYEIKNLMMYQAWQVAGTLPAGNSLRKQLVTKKYAELVATVSGANEADKRLLQYTTYEGGGIMKWANWKCVRPVSPRPPPPEP